MESKSRKPWLPTQVSILLTKSLLFAFLIVSVSCRPKSPEMIQYEKAIDSISSGIQKQYTDFQSIDLSRLRSLQADINLFLSDSEFVSNKNAYTSLITARKFLSDFEKEKSLVEPELLRAIAKLDLMKKNAGSMSVGSGLQIQWIQDNGIENITSKAGYLLNRFSAQALLAETFRKAKDHAKVKK